MSSPEETMPFFDCAIIGAGFAGLVAARRVASMGHTVLVLEARDRFGGRILTQTGLNAPVDTGGSWIHGYNEGNPVKELCEELGIKVTPNASAKSAVITATGEVVPTGIASQISANLGKALASASALSTAHPPPSAEKTLASVMFSSNSPLYKGLESATDKLVAEGVARTMQVGLGVELEKVSLRWTGWSEGYAGTDGAPEGGYMKVIDGLKGLCETEGVVFRLNSVVDAVELEEGGLAVKLSTKEGRVERAKTVISTIPLSVLQNLPLEAFFSPPITPRKASAIERTHVGKLGKIVLCYPAGQVWWDETFGSFTLLSKEEGISSTEAEGTAVQEELESLFGSVSLVTANFALPTLAKPHATLLTYIPVPITDTIESYTDRSALVTALHEYLIARLPRSAQFAHNPTSDLPFPIASAVTDWSTDPFSLGATSTPITIGSERSPLDLVELGKPEWTGRLGFAGEHTEMNHRGSVGGAYESGLREGSRVGKMLRRMGDAKARV